jgi:ABC-2 type transport system permease protein
MPPYHLAQLALGIFGAADGGSPMFHLGALAAVIVGFLAVAGWSYRRDEGRTYG